MKELNKYFDHYTINARFQPAFFSVLPFGLTMLAWCPSANTLIGGTLTILVSFGVMTFISNLISNIANKKQEKLFVQWGGAPTTVIMRYSDDILDKYTKERYHKWLNNKINNLIMPTPEEEINYPEDADQKYQSATNFLREYTRDKKKYSTIYRDNVNYGFSRNLFSIRLLGLTVTIFSVIINSYFIFPLFQLEGIMNHEVLNGNYLFGIGAGVISIIFLFMFTFVINRDYVKERAFRYAKSLFEVCELG